MALYGALKLLNFPFYQENLLHDDVFQGDESSADIELKDLGAGVAMLHHEDEGHFEDMKLASSSSASRSPSYQSANTSINSRDIEIPRSKRRRLSIFRIFGIFSTHSATYSKCVDLLSDSTECF